MEWRRVQVTCVVCGVVVIKNNHAATCSMRCREVLREQKRTADAPTGPCPICGTVTRLVKIAHSYRLCSAKCRATMNGRLYTRAPRQREQERLQRLEYLGSVHACAWCQQPMTITRSDKRCCSVRCADRWFYHHGVKGQRVKLKRQLERAKRNQLIGQCGICQVSHERLRTPKSLGRGGRNGTAIFHRDHIVARAQGGAAGDNLRWACWFCNEARRDLPAQYDGAIAAAGRAFWEAIQHLDVSHA